MKIALSGAHGTGKTTLARLIVGSTPDVRLLPEIPRILLDLTDDPEELRRDRNTFAKQLSIVAAQMGYEGVGALPTERMLLTDRTVADHWAYTMVLFFDEMNRPEARLVESAVNRWLGTYDQIFYLRPEFPPEDDGVREGDLAFQRQIDEVLLGIYERASASLSVLTGSPQQRLDQFNNEVRSFRK